MVSIRQEVCDGDCFNCIYPDCIRDDIGHAMRQEMREIDRSIVFPLSAKQKQIAERQKAYRDRNREQIAEYKKAYYDRNREQIAERQKAYYARNREKIAEYKKAYYARKKRTSHA